MRRILLMVLRNLLIVPGGWIKLCYRASHVDKYTEEDNYEFLRWIVFRANKGGNVTIDVHGQENIPKQDGFMFFPNHQGLYDVLAIVEACTHPFSVVAKKEVENVPFLKQVFKIMKAFMIFYPKFLSIVGISIIGGVIHNQGEIILSSQKERVQKMEIMSVLLKGEALKQQPKQSVRLFRWHLLILLNRLIQTVPDR